MLCFCLRVQRVLEKFLRQEVLFCQENAVPLDSPEADFIKWDCCGSNWGGLCNRWQPLAVRRRLKTLTITGDHRGVLLSILITGAESSSGEDFHLQE